MCHSCISRLYSTSERPIRLAYGNRLTLGLTLLGRRIWNSGQALGGPGQSAKCRPLLPIRIGRGQGQAQASTQRATNEQRLSRAQADRSWYLHEAELSSLCTESEARAHGQWLQWHERQRTMNMKDHDAGRERGGLQASSRGLLIRYTNTAHQQRTLSDSMVSNKPKTCTRVHRPCVPVTKVLRGLRTRASNNQGAS